MKTTLVLILMIGVFFAGYFTRSTDKGYIDTLKHKNDSLRRYVEYTQIKIDSIETESAFKDTIVTKLRDHIQEIENDQNEISIYHEQKREHIINAPDSELLRIIADQRRPANY